MNLSMIDTNRTEGRLLMAALAIITTESRRDKEPDSVLVSCVELADHMYKDATPAGAIISPEKWEAILGERTFSKELTSLINRYNKESGSNTPDFILATFMEHVLAAYDTSVSSRDKWFGIDPLSDDKRIKPESAGSPKE